MFSLSAFASKHGMSKCGFKPMKLVMDALLISGLMQLPGLIYCQVWVAHYQVRDLVEGVLTAWLLTGGAVTYAKAISVGGKGGPIQCLQNIKIVVPLVLWSILRGSLPSVL